MNFYLTCVVVSLVFWAFRSVHEKCHVQEFSGLHYLLGFLLCLVPFANIVTAIFFVEYGILNIWWLRWVEWLLGPLYRLMFIAVYDTSAKEPVTNQKALDATWVKVADEGQSFSVPSSTLVQYGADTTFASSTLSGDVVCSNKVFGDPLPGAVKACYVQQTATATPVVGDVIDTNNHGNAAFAADDHSQRIAVSDIQVTSNEFIQHVHAIAANAVATRDDTRRRQAR